MTASVRVIAAVVALLLVVGAGGALIGGRSGGSSSTASKDSAAPVAKVPACGLLTAAQREALAGAPVDRVTPIESTGTDPVSAESQCRWTSGDLLVQASSMAAPIWAESVPAVIDRLQSSGAKISADDQKQIDQASELLRSSKGLTDEQACGLFSTLAEIGGAPAGSDTLVSYTQLTEKVLAVSAQTCRDGVFTSIVDASPSLKQTGDVTKAAGAAVAAAHARATG